jgi:hypothetical protein
MRRTFEVVLLYLFATGATNLLSLAIPGLTIAHGTTARSGVEQAANNFRPGGGLGETLFGSLLAAAQTFESIAEAVFALPILLGNLGVPSPVIVFVMIPAPLVIVYDAIHIITGRLA